MAMTSEVMAGHRRVGHTPSMFGGELKRWRTARRFSQEALAGAAAVSARHLSCLERGIAWPSEAMVLRLARALDLPLRERGALLGAAGYAARWSDSGDRVPERLEAAVTRLLHGQPSPTFALSGAYVVLDANAAARVVPGALTPGPVVGTDLARAMLGAGPHRRLIEGYDEAAAFLARLRTDAAAQGPTSPLWTLIDEAEAGGLGAPGVAAEPVLPLTIRIGAARTRWLTVLMSFGTPQDAMVEQLTIEQLLPADEETAGFAREVGRAG